MWRTSCVRMTAAACLAAVSAAPAGFGPTVLAIDAAESRVLIQVGKAGLLGFAGHAHEVIAPAVTGSITFDPSDLSATTISLVFDASALRVTGRDEPAADVPEVQRVMVSDRVLDVARYSTIAFHSRRVSVTSSTPTSADALVEGDLTLHGMKRPMSVRVAVAFDGEGGLTARGSFSLKQTEFGIVPVTAAGGAVRVKDELEIQFVFRARPSHESGSAS
jgi:polyisoprenoid-binding protein YceI